MAGLFSLEPLRDNPGAVVDLREKWLNFRPTTFPPNNYLSTEVLTAYDAVFAISHALKQTYLDANNVLVPSAPTGTVNWTQGGDVIAALHQVNFTGLFGPLSFTNQRVKRGFDVYNYQGIAGWSIPMQVSSTLDVSQQQTVVWPGLETTAPTGRAKLSEITLNVASKHYPPYMLYDKEKDTWSGPNWEVLQLVSERTGLQFNMTFTQRGSNDLVGALVSQSLVLVCAHTW